MDGVFEKAFLGVGVEEDQDKGLAKKVRLVYPNPTAWRLFEDVLPTLEQLSDQGWTHLVLSNHVPELRQIIHHLQLDKYIAAVFNSAETGYEKPHEQAFVTLLATLDDIEKIWMIGDDIKVDIAGAFRSGIPGILVRKFHENAKYYVLGRNMVQQISKKNPGCGISPRDRAVQLPLIHFFRRSRAVALPGPG